MRMAYSVLSFGLFAAVAYGIWKLSYRKKKMEGATEPMLSTDEVEKMSSDKSSAQEEVASKAELVLQKGANLEDEDEGVAPSRSAIKDTLEETRLASSTVKTADKSSPSEQPAESGQAVESAPVKATGEVSSIDRRKVRFSNDAPFDFSKTAERGVRIRRAEGSEGSQGSEQGGLLHTEASVCNAEVVSGPSTGMKVAWPATRPTALPYTVGRIPENDLVINDPEVSGRHVSVAWTKQSGRWLLTDEGSLNGTFLNRLPVGTSGTGVRKKSSPVPLSNGDVVTFGSSSRAEISISEPAGFSGRTLPDGGPFSVGVASDPMAARRGKALPMEDVALCQWPLAGVEGLSWPGVASGSLSGCSLSNGGSVWMALVLFHPKEFCGTDGRLISDWGKLVSGTHAAVPWLTRLFVVRLQVGVFCIFDGHCGRGAADAASKLLPAFLSRLLSEPSARNALVEGGDAGPVLRQAFAATEAELTMEDEGCTATVLLAWTRSDPSGCSVQCANVGDSHCYLGVRDKVVQLTEDHRVVNPMERNRLSDAGFKLGETDTRLCGMNIARALGDKFLKGQNVGLSAHPHVSRVHHLTSDNRASIVMASDGLWDVMSGKRALQLAAEVRAACERAAGSGDAGNPAQQAAETLVMRAKMAKAQDNVTALVMNFSASAPARH